MTTKYLQFSVYDIIYSLELL